MDFYVNFLLLFISLRKFLLSNALTTTCYIEFDNACDTIKFSFCDVTKLKCECLPRFHEANEKCVADLGAFCDVPGEPCADVVNSMCTKSYRCECAHGFVPSTNNSSCRAADVQSTRDHMQTSAKHFQDAQDAGPSMNNNNKDMLEFLRAQLTRFQSQNLHNLQRERQQHTSQTYDAIKSLHSILLQNVLKQSNLAEQESISPTVELMLPRPQATNPMPTITDKEKTETNENLDISVLLTLTVNGDISALQCRRNADCTAKTKFSVCRENKCMCSQGYEAVLGHCYPGLETTCSDKLPCGVRHSFCNPDKKCKCKHNFRKTSNQCVSLAPGQEEQQGFQAGSGSLITLPQPHMSQGSHVDWFPALKETHADHETEIDLNDDQILENTKCIAANLPCIGISNSKCSASGYCVCTEGYHKTPIGCRKSSTKAREQVPNDNSESDTPVQMLVPANHNLCSAGYTELDGRCIKGVHLGDQCVHDAQCEYYAQYSTCQRQVCVCRSKYFPNGSADCLPIRGLGEACQFHEQCNVQKSVCFNGICTCDANYVPLAGLCFAGLGQPCSTIYGSAEQRCSGEHMICVNGVCQCKGETLRGDCL